MYRVAKGLKKMSVPIAATITTKIAIVAAQISSFLRKGPRLQSYIVTKLHKRPL